MSSRVVEHHKYHENLKLVRQNPQIDPDRFPNLIFEIIYTKVDSHAECRQEQKNNK